jgi:hypothetical protein
MIELLIYHIHLVCITYAFVKNWLTRGARSGFLIVVTILFLFLIGWALTGTVSKFIIPDSWNGLYFNQDTFSLILVLIPEAFFFYYFIVKDTVTEEEAKLNKDNTDQ